LDPGAAILVQSGFVSDAGKFVSATVDAVIVEIRTGQVTIAKNEIDRAYLFRSRNERIKAGFLWGGIAAGGTAAIMFPVVAQAANPRYTSAGIMTAAQGVAIGAGRMRAFATKRIYQRKN